MDASLLSGYQRDLIRQSLEATLSGRCTITSAVDGATQTWPGATAETACIVTDPGSGGGEVMYSGDEPAVVIHLPVGIAVKTGDHITSGNTTYKVVDVSSARHDDLLMRVSVVEVRLPGGTS